ncbi:GreA/GreB family elongation factor [Candidatus Shikimatogenerans bostrichidophilus]|uniref:GreA/GreB family elongation factor n=1 Tax=Candidatus Shikimatogenerans bostrichidophilus TaxID=2943807 RepID=UPI0029662E17
MEYITKKSLKKIKKKIFSLKKEKKNIINTIQYALEKGDLSENYEYIAAKEKYELLNIEINYLLSYINNIIVVKNKFFNKIKKKQIFLYSKIKLLNLNNKTYNYFQIVPFLDVNIKKNKISIKSPIGSSLIGKKKNDIITINLPNKIIKYKIISIK